MRRFAVLLVFAAAAWLMSFIAFVSSIPDKPPVNLRATDGIVVLTGGRSRLDEAFALLAAERERAQSGKGREVRLSLSDLAAATMGNLGNVAEVLSTGEDRPRSGNNLFGAFGRDFVSGDGVRVMLVAITPKQWNGLVGALGVADEMAALECELGVTLAKDEGARFTHRAKVDPVFETAIARFPLEKLGPMFDEAGCTWSVYRSLHEALDIEPRLSVVKVAEPKKREAGEKVADVDALIAKLKSVGAI